MKKILFIKLNNIKYGIWKDEILLIKNLEKIHTIPFMLKSISTICILDGKIVNLADLSYCLNGSPINKKGPFSILVLSKTDKLIGFIINDILEEIELDNSKTINFPEYFNHPLFHHCLLFNNEIIPIIKINELFTKLLNSNLEPELFNITFKNNENGKPLEKLKYLKCKSEIFAVSPINIEEDIICPEFVCDLPLTPTYIKGITIYKERIIPIIQLSDYFHIDKEQEDDRILIYNVNGQYYGFLISNDLASKQIKEVICKEDGIKQLPFLVQSTWLKEASTQTKEIIPIINLCSVLSNAPSNTSHKQFLNKYKEGSLFISKIFKEEITVVEFSILGLCHAIPDMEVNTIIPFSNIKTFPFVTSIVIGVTLFEDKIIPVLDLTICYGTKLELNNNIKMILVENGNFQAFIVTEKVFGKSKLSVDIQKVLPLYIRKPIVYGCYLKENTVNLIFNIMALTMYFDKEIVQDIFNKLKIKSVEKISDEALEELEEPALKTEEILSVKKEESIKEGDLMEKESPVITNKILKEENQNIEEPLLNESIDLSSSSIEESSNKENINRKLPEIEGNNEPSLMGNSKSTILEEDKIESTIQKKTSVQSAQRKQKQGGHKKFLVPAILFIVTIFMIALIADIFNLGGIEEPDIVNTMADNQNKEISNEIQEEADNEIQEVAIIEIQEEIKKEIQEEIKNLFIEDVNVVADIEGISITVQNIKFNPDSYELLPDQLSELNKIVEILKNYPDKNILIIGHTAYNGTYISLQELSEKRAEAVSTYLLSFSIWKDEQITWKGLGPSEPIADNNTEEGRQSNRRVEIKILND